jgi:hypothetical protein
MPPRRSLPPDAELAVKGHVWLKHASLKIGGPRIEEATITELEVIYTIWRAISKFQAVYRATDADRTPQMLRFENWARERLQELEI